MKVTDAMATELAAVETVIESAVESVFPPVFAARIIDSEIFAGYLTKVTDMIIPFMDADTGMIDGAAAREAISMAFPDVSKWINIPAKKFAVADMVNDFTTALFGRSVM